MRSCGREIFRKFWVIRGVCEWVVEHVRVLNSNVLVWSFVVVDVCFVDSLQDVESFRDACKDGVFSVKRWQVVVGEREVERACVRVGHTCVRHGNEPSLVMFCRW